MLWAVSKKVVPVCDAGGAVGQPAGLRLMWHAANNAMAPTAQNSRFIIL
jgi:hypothetical protein